MCLLNMSFGIGLGEASHMMLNFFLGMWLVFSSPMPKDMLRRQLVLRTLEASIQQCRTAAQKPFFLICKTFCILLLYILYDCKSKDNTMYVLYILYDCRSKDNTMYVLYILYDCKSRDNAMYVLNILYDCKSRDNTMYILFILYDCKSKDRTMHVL